jgi:hypothetical protein
MICQYLENTTAIFLRACPDVLLFAWLTGAASSEMRRNSLLASGPAENMKRQRLIICQTISHGERIPDVRMHSALQPCRAVYVYKTHLQKIGLLKISIDQVPRLSKRTEYPGRRARRRTSGSSFQEDCGPAFQTELIHFQQIKSIRGNPVRDHSVIPDLGEIADTL